MCEFSELAALAGACRLIAWALLACAPGLAAASGFADATVAVPATPAATLTSSDAQLCKRLSPRLPGVSTKECEEAGLLPSGGRSLKNFPILFRRFPATFNSGKPPVRVMVIGGIHGDELSAASIVFKWLPLIETPEARRFDWNIIPLVNPDGLLAKRPSRVNANGVDLNRNFPTPGWQEEAPAYWARKTKSDPRRYPGKAPLSEPESRWLDEEMKRFKPQVIISVHAPYGVLDFDGPAEPPRRFGRLNLNRVGVYPGSLGNYGGLHKNVPVVTIELPEARTVPSQTEVRRIWQDMLRWIENNVTPAEPVIEAARPLPAAPAAGKKENTPGLLERLRAWFGFSPSPSRN